jgi:hypothetical protein
MPVTSWQCSGIALRIAQGVEKLSAHLWTAVASANDASAIDSAQARCSV